MKRGINFKMSDTLFRVSFAVLCSSIGTQLTRRGGGEMSANVCRPIVKCLVNYACVNSKYFDYG